MSMKPDLLFELLRPLATGGLGGPVLLPARSLPLFVFVDASGQQPRERLWGGLAALGEGAAGWINSAMERLRRAQPSDGAHAGELKGRDVAPAAIEQEWRSLSASAQRLYFWASPYAAAAEPLVRGVHDEFAEVLAMYRQGVAAGELPAFGGMPPEEEAYFERLGDVNRNKVLSILAHIKHLGSHIREARMGHALSSATVIIDREDFPALAQCERLVCSYVRTVLQRTGAHLEAQLQATAKTHHGGIHVRANADSREYAGIQYADVLLQHARRRLHTEIAPVIARALSTP
jgi:hypothetical protein